MADLTELKNIVRKGTVQSVDKKKMKARVKFGDKGGIISGELHILIQKRHIIHDTVEAWLEDEADRIKKDVTDVSINASYHDDEVIRDPSPSVHKAWLAYWLPEVGDMVLCLMIPDGDGEGYILGGIK